MTNFPNSKTLYAQKGMGLIHQFQRVFCAMMTIDGYQKFAFIDYETEYLLAHLNATRLGIDKQYSRVMSFLALNVDIDTKLQ